MKEFKPFKEGKVREVYDNGDSLIIVATDRISAFDNILKNRITDKGAILTQMSKFWFDFTKDVVPNHMISVDVRDMPEFFQQERFDGNSMMCKKLEMLPIECIVRGYITGSGWASYKENGTVCGIKLPEGLVESDKLPEPIYTPSTKADLGDHDENISFEQSVDVLEKIYPGKDLITQHRSRIAPSLSTRNVQSMHFPKELSLQIPSLSSVWTRTVKSFSVMRCLHRTAPDSGHWKGTSRDRDSLLSTSSMSETGSRQIRTMISFFRKKLLQRPLISTKKHMSF